MESANKAIIMAFGMMVGVMILAAIVYVFGNLKIMPNMDDDIETAEQLSTFNREYEIYNKKIMYGVDVISVLNKARSNNEKYVQENFFSGVGYNTDYIIDIQVRIKNDLEERLVVSYMESTTSGVFERDYPENQGSNKNLLHEAGATFKAPSSTYCSLIYSGGNVWTTMQLKSKVIPTSIRTGTYHLLSGTGLDGRNPNEHPYTNAMLEGDSILKSLLEQATEMSQTVKNRGTNTLKVGGPYGAIDETNTGWNKFVWYPAIYDLKTRKFRCIADETVYSEKTGRIVKMAFEEI